MEQSTSRPPDPTEEELLDDWNSSLMKYLIVNNVVLFLYLTLGIAGNIIVILVYIFKMKIKRDDRFFIPALAVTDFTAILIGGTFAFAWNMLPVKFKNGTACQTLWFFSQTATITSGFMLLIIAVQRYLKVCKTKVKFPQKLKYILIVISVGFGAAFSIPIFFFYGNVEIIHPINNVTGHWCGQKRTDVNGVIIYDISVVTIAILASLTLITLYILIGKTIYQKFLIFKKSVQEGKFDPSRRSSVDLDHVSSFQNLKRTANSRANSIDDLVECDTYRRKVKRGSNDVLDQGRFFTIGQHFRTHRYSYMFMTITALFITAYAPRVSIMLIETLNPAFWDRPSEEIAGFLFLYRMYILNHALNPFIYAFFDTRFRKEVSDLLFCCCGRSKTVSL